MSRIDLYGKDLKFPLQVDANGNLATISGIDNVRQAIIDTIETFQGEALYHEGYGVGLPGGLHRKGQILATTYAHRIQDQIMEHEARVKSIDIKGTYDHENRSLIFDVTYTLIGYHHEDNFVYPLRLENEKL